jgi:RHS repeat-associated protein
VAEYQNGSTQTFAQSYIYDRFGNRTIDQTNTWGTGIPKPNFGVDTSTNRLTAPAGYTMSYDAAGNQTNDNYTGQGVRTYDGENRMKQAWANNQWQTYTYDADGRRIKRNVNGSETWQVYGMDGELLAEYQSGAAPNLPVTEYGYRGGNLLTTITSGDTQRLTRSVYNLYYGALQRDPTAAELQDKINQLGAAGVVSQAQLLTTASQIARSLFTSTNYETSPPARSDIQYVSDLYYAYLQRGPDDSGLNWWAVTVLPTSSRENVCNAFEASAEFQTLVATLYGTAASDNERTEHLVNNFYLGAYGRNATSAELQQQRDALNAAAAQGQAQVQAQAETFGRSLFVSQINDAGLSNTQYVTNLYEAFLQRGPDAGGLSFWAGQASVGQGRQNVLDQFASCSPFRELAGTLYREANWLVADHLGTPRMVVNKSGSLSGVKRHDYLPFGEELSAGPGGRTTTQGYTGDSVRQKFTLKERDNETGLDFFEARYYASTQGRFTSADPLQASAKRRNPQTWNRYTYGLNNPLRYTDPDGEDPGDVYMRTTIKTTEITVQEVYKGQITQQAKVTVTESQTEYLNDKGEVLKSDPIQTSATAVNTGKGARDYSQEQRDTMANVAQNIVEVSRDKGFDATLALGIAQRETNLGTAPDTQGVEWKNSAINPMQLSEGAAKGGTLRSNIAGAIDLFNSKPGKTEEEKLGQYRGSGSARIDANYASSTEGFANTIRSSVQARTPTYNLNQRPARFGFPTRPH